SDAGQGTDSKLGACWIAEALYGIDAPQTTLVRAWLFQASCEKYGWWLFRRLYQAVGPDVATLIRRRYIPRSLPLPLFDALVAKANAAFSKRLREGRGQDLGSLQN